MDHKMQECEQELIDEWVGLANLVYNNKKRKCYWTYFQTTVAFLKNSIFDVKK